MNKKPYHRFDIENKVWEKIELHLTNGSNTVE